MDVIGDPGEGQIGQRKSGMNKYTIVCALLASANSILLGYGKFFVGFSYHFGRNLLLPFSKLVIITFLIHKNKVFYFSQNDL